MTKRRSAVLCVLIAVIFLGCWIAGEHPPHPTALPIRIAVVVSGLFWLMAAIIPIWLDTEVNFTAIANSIAASAAIYAGLAAHGP